MLRAKAVDFFAHRSGIVEGGIAEREVVLTYALDLLHVSERLPRFAFKGGTCIRKVYLGSTGRFSMDLDFTACEPMDAGDAILDLASHVFNQTHHGIEFSLDEGGWRTTQGGRSYTVQVGYRHDWNDDGGFDLQVNLREQPTLDVELLPQIPQAYFPELEFDPRAVPCLDKHEILAEKVRAAYQRARVRDLHDLYGLFHAASGSSAPAALGGHQTVAGGRPVRAGCVLRPTSAQPLRLGGPVTAHQVQSENRSREYHPPVRIRLHVPARPD